MVKIEQKVRIPANAEMPSKKPCGIRLSEGKSVTFVVVSHGIYAPVCGLLTASFFGTVLRAVHSFSVSWNGLPHCLQWVVGVCVNTASNSASSGRTDLRKYLHSALLVNRSQHWTVTVQWQAAVLFVVVGNIWNNQLFDPVFSPFLSAHDRFWPWQFPPFIQRWK